ncbi:MAG: 16S rRNA (uracil(1498)-N(3))-methyltransferase [Treponema sp.]|jgi:16S rRNA (uracil1498-N3)-methyltransferase|nr:16S rRNA (uracil(1498)-N(3))-methyltransferase [Treponema sp.]
MKRFVLPFPPSPEGMIRLYEDDYHYLVRVKRLEAGMRFDAILPGGKESQIHILSTADNILIGECMGEMEKMPSTLPPIALFQGFPKGSKMDLIVRQAAEGGVSIVAPFVSEFSTVKLKKDYGEKVKRWERIVREARQQSGSEIKTEILPPMSFDSLLEYWESLKKEYQRPLGILFHQAPLEKGTFHDYLNNYPDFVALAVGPEGGFSRQEVSRFLSVGWKPMVMGNTVLRTETAALYGTAAIRIILLESEAWTPDQRGSSSLKFP